MAKNTPKAVIPAHIKNLLKPMPEKTNDRKVWSVALQGVWLPFFTSTNAAGGTAIAPEALGAPLRLAREKDGTPKFNENGRPVVRVVKDIADQVRIVRENFVAGLVAYAASVQKTMPAEYKAVVEASAKAGEPIMAKDAQDVAEVMAAQAESLAAQAQAVADAAQAQAPTTEVPAPEPEKELVAA